MHSICWKESQSLCHQFSLDLLDSYDRLAEPIKSALYLAPAATGPRHPLRQPPPLKRIGERIMNPHMLFPTSGEALGWICGEVYLSIKLDSGLQALVAKKANYPTSPGGQDTLNTYGSENLVSRAMLSLTYITFC